MSLSHLVLVRNYNYVVTIITLVLEIKPKHFHNCMCLNVRVFVLSHLKWCMTTCSMPGCPLTLRLQKRRAVTLIILSPASPILLLSRSLSAIVLSDIFILITPSSSGEVCEGVFLNRTRIKVNKYWQSPSPVLGLLFFTLITVTTKLFPNVKCNSAPVSLTYLAVSCDFPCLSAPASHSQDSLHFSAPLPCGAR